MSRLYNEVFQPQLWELQSSLVQKVKLQREKRQKELDESPKIRKLLAQLNKIKDDLDRMGFSVSTSGWGYGKDSGATFIIHAKSTHPEMLRFEKVDNLIKSEFSKLSRKAITADEVSKGRKVDWMTDALAELKKLALQLDACIKP